LHFEILIFFKKSPKLDEVNKMDDKDYGIEQIIQQMRIRHEKLRGQLALQRG